MEKLYNLDELKNMTPDELDYFGELIITKLSLKNCVDVLLDILDNIYILDDNDKFNIEITNFLAHNRFNQHRELMRRIYDITDEEWQRLDVEYKRKVRKMKLENLYKD